MVALVLDQFAPAHLHLRFDRIELNLGTFDPAHLDADLPARLAQALAAWLRQHSMTADERPASPVDAGRPHRHLDLVEHYLLHGFVSVWQGSGSPSIGQMLDQLADTAPDALLAMLRRHGSDPVFVQRLLQRLAPRQQRRLLELRQTMPWLDELTSLLVQAVRTGTALSRSDAERSLLAALLRVSLGTPVPASDTLATLLPPLRRALLAAPPPGRTVRSLAVLLRRVARSQPRWAGLMPTAADIRAATQQAGSPLLSVQPTDEQDEAENEVMPSAELAARRRRPDEQSLRLGDALPVADTRQTADVLPVGEAPPTAVSSASPQAYLDLWQHLLDRGAPPWWMEAVWGRRAVAQVIDSAWEAQQEALLDLAVRQMAAATQPAGQALLAGYLMRYLGVARVQVLPGLRDAIYGTLAGVQAEAWQALLAARWPGRDPAQTQLLVWSALLTSLMGPEAMSQQVRVQRTLAALARQTGESQQDLRRRLYALVREEVQRGKTAWLPLRTLLGEQLRADASPADRPTTDVPSPDALSDLPPAQLPESEVDSLVPEPVVDPAPVRLSTDEVPAVPDLPPLPVAGEVWSAPDLLVPQAAAESAASVEMLPAVWAAIEPTAGLDLLRHYLLHGSLPVLPQRVSQTDFIAMIGWLAAEVPVLLGRLLGRSIRSPEQRRRLARILPGRLMPRVLDLLPSLRGSELGRAYPALEQLLRPAEAVLPVHEVREAVLDFAGWAEGHSPEPHRLLLSLLRHLSRKSDRSVTDWIGVLQAAIPAADSALHASEWPTLLEVLARGERHKQPAPEPPLPQPQPRKTRQPLPGDLGIPVHNAGLVLLWPFLSHYFKTLRLLTPQRTFADADARQRAIHLTQYLVNKRCDLPEEDLVLNKLLCGWPLQDPIVPSIALQEEEATLGEQLLAAACKQWPPMQNASNDGFRGSFLLRNGLVSLQQNGNWRLRIEKKPYDLLLDKLGWGISMIRLSWMPYLLHVEWR
ncbi:MAG: hypothetical protein OHK0039_16300 [Bacteroidia bacterium]